MTENTDLIYTIPESRLQQSEVKRGVLQLYNYQAEGISAIQNAEKCLIEVHAGTGMGKTAVAVLSTLDSDTKTALMIYPTNELIENQQESIRKTCEMSGVEDPIIEIVHSSELRAMLNEERYRKKSQALASKLSPRPGKVKFVLTNPDTLHLILRLKYGGPQRYGHAVAEILSKLLVYTTLVIDEFHTYERRELASIFFDIALGRFMGYFKKTILLTATPNKGLESHLSKLASASDMVYPTPIASQISSTGRIVAHPVKLIIRSVGDDFNSQIVQYLLDRKQDLEKFRLENSESKNKFVPACIILNSVIAARALTERLLEEFEMTQIAESHGLVPQKMREITEEILILVGTSAIEVGIDFDTNILIFEGSNSPSTIQRFGRIGRHQPGEALFYSPEYVFNYFNEYVKEIKSRDEFVDLILDAYGEKDPGLWYLQSPFSIIEIQFTLEELAKYSELTESGGSFYSRSELFDFFEKIYPPNIDSKGIEDWVETIKSVDSSLVTLRSSQPAALVRDFVAQKRGLFPFYSSPVSRILRRAMKFNVYPGNDLKRKGKFLGTSKTLNSSAVDVAYDLFSEFSSHVSAGRKVCYVDLMGYMKSGYRSIKMSLAGNIPDHSSFRPIVGVNSPGLFGNDVGIEHVGDWVEIVDELFLGELYAVVDNLTAREIGWQVESYPIILGENWGRIFFGGNALVALAKYWSREINTDE
ncbi:MAG: hypothetical protein BAJATHORv1_130006 [Candidatus Thorarchaeota archaeon]|nr:MAG: hypothetical protein BAJATHORv1_130006 [Candidatus Thorarchaeota archaeon]